YVRHRYVTEPRPLGSRSSLCAGSRLLNHTPYFLKILPRCREISDGKTQRKAAIENRVREKCPARRIDLIEQSLIVLVGPPITEADQRERRRRSYFEIRVRPDQTRQPLRVIDM